jgi:hypothetical protein
MNMRKILQVVAVNCRFKNLRIANLMIMCGFHRSIEEFLLDLEYVREEQILNLNVLLKHFDEV